MDIDPIAGLNSDFVLSLELREYLKYYGITNLMQAHNPGLSPTSNSYWLLADDLELGRLWKEEWTCYIDGISHSGIKLSKRDDRLLWMHNTINGDVSAHLAYDLIASSCSDILSGW